MGEPEPADLALNLLEGARQDIRDIASLHLELVGPISAKKLPTEYLTHWKFFVLPLNWDLKPRTQNFGKRVIVCLL